MQNSPSNAMPNGIGWRVSNGILYNYIQKPFNFSQFIWNCSIFTKKIKNSDERITYASSVPSGTAQYSGDGKPKISVDSQHNADGIYENITKMASPMAMPQTISFSYELRHSTRMNFKLSTSLNIENCVDFSSVVHL